MKFPAPAEAVTPPLALQALDESIGTQTREAYQAAVNASPQLGGIAVVFTDKGTSFSPSKLGLPGSQVYLNPDREYYKEAIRSGLARNRMGEYGSLYRVNGIVPGVNELIVAALLHEIGHADDFGSYVTRASGDTVAAFEMANQVRQSELATLPLKAATSRAANAWKNNIEGYQDQLRAQGITDEQWQKMLNENTRAYSELSCEAIADRFALGVLATVQD